MRVFDRPTRMVLATYCVALCASPSLADDVTDVRVAAERAVRLVERTSAKFLETKTCFACHTQTLSAMVLAEASEAGFEVDARNLQRQVERVSEVRESLYGLRVDTVGYGLWALDIGKHAPDAATKDMVQYLLDYQPALGHWEVTVDRPPAEASHFTTNYVAIRGLKRYGTTEQQDAIAARVAAVKQWLATVDAEKAKTLDTEDAVFRLRLAAELEHAPDELKPLVENLLERQDDAGGWPQKPGMKPDAYATGSALVALSEAGGVPTIHAAWERGIAFLLRTQQEDGSWRVATRAKPIQEYFESGFPHGKDQFISAFATGWATEALLLQLRVEK